jgi:hypothetical protein
MGKKVKGGGGIFPSLQNFLITNNFSKKMSSYEKKNKLVSPKKKNS